jgi:hypothetical protein
VKRALVVVLSMLVPRLAVAQEDAPPAAVAEGGKSVDASTTNFRVAGGLDAGELALDGSHGTLVLPAWGPAVGGAAGARRGAMQIQSELEYANPHSRNGLAFHDARLAATVAYVQSRFMIGGGVDGGWLGLVRESADGSVNWTIRVGAHALGAVDVMRFERGALFVAVRPMVTASNGWWYAASAMLGASFFP